MSKITSKAETKNKCQYKILNWPEYNKSLIKWGDIPILIDEEAINNWYQEGPAQQEHNTIIRMIAKPACWD